MNSELLETLVVGAVLGSSYAFAALGLSLIYGILGVVNFAHGELLLLGAVSGALVFPLFGADFTLAALAVSLIGFLTGLLLQAAVFRPLRRGGVVGPMIGSLGLSVGIYNLVNYGFSIYCDGQPLLFRASSGSHIRLFGIPIEETISLFGTRISPLRLAILGATLVLVVAVSLLITKTQFGRALRAVAWDRDTAILIGINTESVTRNAVALGVMLTFLAGLLSGALISVTPTMGIQQGLKSFAVVICAGFGNIRAVLPVGIMIGIVEALAVARVGAQSQYTWVFGFLCLLILLRPTGLIPEQVPENL